MEKQQAEFADSPMLKFSTYSAGLRQGCFLKVSEPEVHRCGEFGMSHRFSSQEEHNMSVIFFNHFFLSKQCSPSPPPPPSSKVMVLLFIHYLLFIAAPIIYGGFVFGTCFILFGFWLNVPVNRYGHVDPWISNLTRYRLRYGAPTYFVMKCFASFLVLQSSRWARQSWLLDLSAGCHVAAIVICLFLTVPWVGLWCVAFPGHTHLLFLFLL